MTEIKRGYKAILFISGCWLISFLLVSPLHDYPLNDDWSYATTVKHMVENGEYYLTDWLAGPMVTQALWGYLFSTPFGFSYLALVISTLVLGLVGAIFTYLIFRLLGVNLIVALLISLLIAFNPIYFSLSVTFMTDIHFYTFFVISIYFFLKYAINRSYYYFLIGCLAALAATLIRQFGLTITLAFLFYEIICYRKFNTKPVFYLLAANAIIILLYVLYSLWLKQIGQLPDNFRNIGEIMNFSLAELSWRIITRTGHILHETGFWLFPFLLFFSLYYWRALKFKPKLIAVVLAIFIFPVIRTVGDFPGGNIFNTNWIGPITTVDVFIYELGTSGFELHTLSIIFKIISTTGALMLLYLITISLSDIIKKRNKMEIPGKVYLNDIKPYAMLILILYLGIVMINFTYFDRYMLPVLLLLLIIILPLQIKATKLFYALVSIYLLFLAGYSILLTRDYLEFNTNKWEAASKLTDKGINDDLIDAGHEYNGWQGAKIDKMGKWDPKNYSYAVTISKLENYIVVDSVPVSLTLIPSINKLYILKKMNENE